MVLGESIASNGHLFQEKQDKSRNCVLNITDRRTPGLLLIPFGRLPS